jgi:hypothetical protein
VGEAGSKSNLIEYCADVSQINVSIFCLWLGSQRLTTFH